MRRPSRPAHPSVRRSGGYPGHRRASHRRQPLRRQPRGVDAPRSSASSTRSGRTSTRARTISSPSSTMSSWPSRASSGWTAAMGGASTSSNGHVHPDWRRRGIGGRCSGSNERRLAELAGEPRRAPSARARHARGAGRRAVPSALARAAAATSSVRVYHLMVRPDMEDILAAAHRRWPRGATADGRAAAAALGRHDRGLPRPLRWRRHLARPPTDAGRRTPISTSR